ARRFSIRRSTRRRVSQPAGRNGHQGTDADASRPGERCPEGGDVSARRKRKTEAEIRAECERGRDTLWTDARWYEVLTGDEIQAIVSEYGFGPLTPSNRVRREALRDA